MALVKARYTGPFEAHDSLMRTIHPGEEIEVTSEQIKGCNWFQPISKAAESKSKAEAS